MDISFKQAVILVLLLGLASGFGRAMATDFLADDPPRQVKVLCTTTTEDLTGGKVNVSTRCTTERADG